MDHVCIGSYLDSQNFAPTFPPLLYPTPHPPGALSILTVFLHPCVSGSPKHQQPTRPPPSHVHPESTIPCVPEQTHDPAVERPLFFPPKSESPGPSVFEYLALTPSCLFLVNQATPRISPIFVLNIRSLFFLRIQVGIARSKAMFGRVSSALF